MKIENTLENAQEVDKWLKENKDIKSIILSKFILSFTKKYHDF